MAKIKTQHHNSIATLITATKHIKFQQMRMHEEVTLSIPVKINVLLSVILTSVVMVSVVAPLEAVKNTGEHLVQFNPVQFFPSVESFSPIKLFTAVIYEFS
jgi:hypothetical protein